LDDWLADLASREHLTRLRAVDALRTHSLDMVREIAAMALSDRRANAQAAGARLIGERSIAGLRGALETMVADRGRAVRARKASVVALGQLGSPDSLAAIGSLESHPNDMVRRALMEAAGRIGTAGALPLLVAGLGDGAWQVRMDAATGLGGMPDGVAAAAFEALDGAWSVEPDVRTGEQMLRAMAEVAWPGLRTVATARFMGVLASGADWRWRRAAARGLGEVGFGEAAQTALQSALETSAGAVAEEIVWSLRAMEKGG
jgi:HEAT repeat protein